MSYGIGSFTLLNYFFKHTPLFLIDMKTLAMDIIRLAKNEGFHTLYWQTFEQIFVPFHFFLFWTLTILTKIYYLQMFATTVNDNQNDHLEWIPLLLNSVSSIFISPVSLLSTSITVAYISCFILNTIKLYLSGGTDYQNHNQQQHHHHHPIAAYRDHNGWEEGMTTMLLTTITAFTDMNENTRMAVMVIISFVVISSLLQSILEISEPVILSLNMNHNINRIHHLKVLLLCAFLFIFPLYVTNVYAKIFPANFWIAVVFSTSLLISARVLDLIIIHCLFWWDSCRTESWEYLDEIIYFARSFTKFIEFIISISVVIVGIWEALNNRSNILNATILIMHGYYNVWQRINHGMNSYNRRRQANRIVDQLCLVENVEQLNKYDDLCSICYSEMKLMKSSMVIVITDCKHLFHRKCIKKWLAIQNRCPLCSTQIEEADKSVNQSIDSPTAATTMEQSFVEEIKSENN